MIDYEIEVAYGDETFNLAHDELPDGVRLNEVEFVSQDTELSDSTIVELLRSSNSAEQLSDRIEALEDSDLTGAEIAEIDMANIDEVADNIDDVYVSDDYDDWLMKQDYIVGEIRNIMPGTLGEVVIESLDAENIFNAGDTSVAQVLSSGRIVEFMV
jgi:hypothetical protein